MENQVVKRIIEKYREVYDAIPQEALDLDLQVTVKTIQALAKGNPVSPEALAKIWGLPLDQVRAILAQAKEAGRVEIDTQGNLVGAVLSLNPSDHQVSLGDKHLYAWCAYDAIYTPLVVGEGAEINSNDPVTGEPIQIAISPGGIEKIQPESAVVSIVDAGVIMSTGPESSRCTQMLFFESPESAEQWKRGREGIFILTVEEVLEVVNEFQIKLAVRLGLI